MCEGCAPASYSPDGMINHNCSLCRAHIPHNKHATGAGYPVEAEKKDTNPKDAIAGNKVALWLVPPILKIITEPAMRLGASKYGPYNWREKGVKLTVYLDAMERHITAIREGQDIDPESGQPHLGHISAGVAIVADAQAIGKLIDDRPTIKGGAVKLMEEISESYRS